MKEAELIVLAAARHKDPYYQEVRDEIFEFHVTYARRIIDAGDRVLVLTDKERFRTYADALGEQHVAIAPMDDIWMRDFGLSNAEKPVMFRYTAAGQGGGRESQDTADAVQERLAQYLDDAELDYRPSNFLNDGGNVVDDYDGRLVVSRKFLRDNALEEEAGRARLRRLTGARHVAFIEADEQGGLEHADGVVAFIHTNTLVINSYPDDPEYAAALKTDLREGLPGVAIHEIVTPYDGTAIYDDRFGSACGLYTNMLVTPRHIYLPQFGIPEDVVALEQVRSVTDRRVIPVPSGEVCHMGGGVRCLSWQLRGRNAAALLRLFGKGA